MAEPQDMILPLLREIRSRLDSVENGQKAGFEDLRKRIDSVKQAAFGESLVGRYMAAEVEDRLSEIEKRLDALEKAR